MSTVRNRMQALLDETEVPAFEMDMSVKRIVPQLVLAMQALGLDTSDEEQLDEFLKTLKALATSKSQLVKSAIKHWSGAKSGRALRIAKKAV